jgi:hypothetical protein
MSIMSPMRQHWIKACSETISIASELVAWLVLVMELVLDEKALLLLLLLEEVAAVVEAPIMAVVRIGYLVASPAITSVSMSSKASSAV